MDYWRTLFDRRRLPIRPTQPIAPILPAPPIDQTPDVFSFTNVTNAALSTVYTSNAITVSGVTPGINVSGSLSGTGFTYSQNGGAYQASGSFTFQNGDTFTLRGTSSGAYSTGETAVLSLGIMLGNWQLVTVAPLTLATPTLTRTSSAGTNPPTWDAAMTDLQNGDTIELYYTTDGSTPVANGSPQGTHTAVATEETINWGAAWPASFTGGATIKWAERYGRNPGTGMVWSPLSNVLSDVMPSTPWNPNAAPAGQNLSFVSTATFASENFLTGTGIVIVSVDNGQPSGVTVGGSSATLVKTSNATGVRSVSIWKIATTAGAKNVVISGSGIAGIAIITGTLVGMNATETSTGALAYGFGADPQTTGSITCPSGGVIIAALVSEADANAPTWTTGTPDCDVRVSGRLRHTTAHLSATGAPTVTGYNGSGSGMAAAAWGP